MRPPKKPKPRQRPDCKPQKGRVQTKQTRKAAAPAGKSSQGERRREPADGRQSASQQSAPARQRRKPAFRRFAGGGDRGGGGDHAGGLHLFGIHAVAAALGNPRRIISRLRLSEGAAHKLASALEARNLRPEHVEPKDLDQLLGADQVHQGALLITQPLPEPGLPALAETSANGGGPVIILDQVTDPHNVGAILRSAAVFGAAGIVMTRRHSPPLAGTLAKSASGALELVPVTLVTNLSRAMRELKDLGLQCIGLDGSAGVALEARPFDGPSALVLGAEGAGLRRLTRETCDSLCCISGGGPLRSLNVSNAAAVALHLAAMRRCACGPTC